MHAGNFVSKKNYPVVICFGNALSGAVILAISINIRDTLAK